MIIRNSVRKKNVEFIRANFCPLRLGETSRQCAYCGNEFVPTSRTQKYCRPCGKTRPWRK